MSSSKYSLENKTPEEMQKARKYAAEINHALADGAFSKDSGLADHVDRQAYQDHQRSIARSIEVGTKDGNFTVWQRMYYYFTGESIAFLPK